MIIKNFIPCIFLHEENAVRSINDFTVVDTNPLKLVNLYNERGADKLIVFDLSADSKEKEKNLDVIRDICNTSEIPVIACGNIQNESDVNILFYAGCDKVVLDFDLQSNIQIAEKVSKKWGKNNLIAEISTPQAIQNYNEMIAAVTSELLIMNSHLIQQVTESTHLPYIVYINESTLGRIIDICKLFGLSGVTGNVINDNINDVGSLKQICEANNVPINVLTPAFKWEDFKLNSDGMIPVIVQDYKTNEVLMLAYMNKEAYETTLKTGKMTYYSRSRRELWIKGLTSGHFQYVKSLEIDCDYDTILARVSQKGAACHTGSRNCFFNNITKRG